MRAARLLALALLAALLPIAARAAGDGGHGAGATTIFWHAFNLLVLIGVLVYFARAPIASYLAERRSQIEEGIESAGRELAEAERRLAACEQRAASLEGELDEIRRVVRQQAEGERDRLLAEAQATAERIERDAVAAAEQEVRHARERLRAETVDLAIQIAGETLRGQVTDADRARLVDDFVQRIERSGSGTGSLARS
ncbi:MAG: ATP synthase F0 subunit B [Deltaproteobacteria bacterium]|nr:ATP synthase F0 subunit B [Deltaproteobacteria bacterium]